MFASVNMDITEWKLWLTKDRLITDEVASFAQLDFDLARQELRIPIIDKDGKILFSKYRRSPRTTEGPKYRYEKGSTAQLYGADMLAKLFPSMPVIVVEGELDALALRSVDIPAVSSTGGSKTWNAEWAEMLKPFQVILAYDADVAGVEGMMRVHTMLPSARIAWLPVQYGKDPTEMLKEGKEDEIRQALLDAKVYPDISPNEDATARLTALGLMRAELKKERDDNNKAWAKTPFHQDIALAWLDREMEAERKNIFSDSVPATNKTGMDGDIERAKQYPIGKLIKVNRMGFADCPFHHEKTGSFKIYKDNHAYCFGCGRRADAIDIYRELNGCTFKEAIAALI